MLKPRVIPLNFLGQLKGRTSLSEINCLFIGIFRIRLAHLRSEQSSKTSPEYGFSCIFLGTMLIVLFTKSSLVVISFSLCFLKKKCFVCLSKSLMCDLKSDAYTGYTILYAHKMLIFKIKEL